MKAKMIFLSSLRWSSPGVVLGVLLALTDRSWLISLLVAAVAFVGARYLFWFWLSTQTNRDEVVGTEHVMEGQVEAIEVFWRPG